MAKRNVSADINRPLSVTVTNAGAAAAGGGSGTLPGTITGTTTNTVVGGRHFHAIQLAHEHLLNVGAEDHHPLVTPGNTAIGVSGQAVSVNLAAVSGLEVSSGLRLADSVAGDGLSIANKVLAVGVSGLGLSVGADAVTLTSSSNPGAAASILASDASGYLQLTRLGLNRAPLYPLHVAGATQQVRVDYNDSNYLSLTVGGDGAATLATVGASANLNLNPGGDVVFDPTGNDLLPATGYDLNLGSLQKKYLTLHAAELWVETLVAQDTIATIGGRILVGPTTKLTGDLSDIVDRIDVEHNSLAYNDTVYLEANGKVEFMLVIGWPFVEVDATNDWFKVGGNATALFSTGIYFTVSGSTGNNGEWVVASSNYDGANTTIYVTGNVTSAVGDGRIVYIGEQGVGPFRYRVTRDRDGSGANAWYAGDAVFNTGQVGNGFIDLYSVRGVRSGYGPTIVGNVRNSTTFNDWSEHWAIGNLNGIYGYGSTTYGAAFGRYANDSSFLTADATNGIRILKRAADANTVLAQWAMDGAITIGEVAAGQSNVQISAGALSIRNNTTERIGLTAAGVLTIKDSQGNAVITLDASAGAEITKKLTMPGANSAIAIGATPPTAATTGTGIWIDRTGMYGLASNVLQAKFDATTGAITAGAGGVTLDSTGIALLTKGEAQTTYLTWKDASGNTIGQVTTRRNDGIYYNSDTFEFLTYLSGPGSVTRFGVNSFHILEMEPPTLTSRLKRWNGSSWDTLQSWHYNGCTFGTGLTVSGGLNLGTATGAGAGEVLGKGAANYLRWVLENTQSNPNLTDIGVIDSAGKGIYIGRRGPSDTTYSGYGPAGDAYIYTGGSGNGLNILVPDSTNGILRFYVGTNASGAPRVTFLRSGRVLIGTTSDDGVNLLQVNGSVKATYAEMNWLQILDGVAAPATVAGWARIYVDSADGDLKIKFGNGTVKTIVTD